MRYYLGTIHITDIPPVDGSIPTGKIVETVSSVLKTFAAQSGEESASTQTPPAQLEVTDEPEVKKSPEEEEMERVYREWKAQQRRKQEAERRKSERKRKRRLDAVFWGVILVIVGIYASFTGVEELELPKPLADILDGQQTEQQFPDGESPSQEETQEDSQAYFTYEGNQIPVYDLPKRQVNAGDFVWDGDRLLYVGSQFDVSFGVDVSAYQNDLRMNKGYMLDWEAAKADGVDFALVRVGVRSGQLYEDDYYARNIDGAMAAGLTTGVYLSSMAVNTEETLEEADFVLERLKTHSINGPVVYDLEVPYQNAGSPKQITTLCVKAFCERIREAGYTPMIRMSRNVAYIKYDLSELPYPIWYTQWPSKSTAEPYPDFLYQMDVWQFGYSVEVDGLENVGASLWFHSKAS